MNNWKWFGSPGHFICSKDCQFHLCTLVGKYLVSTVGEMVPDSPVREIYASTHGVVLTGRGDERLADYMDKIGFYDIGYGRKYETMVFLAGKPCTQIKCRCGLPEQSGEEVDFLGYNDRASATDGHMKLCRKWSKKK